MDLGGHILKKHPLQALSEDYLSEKKVSRQTLKSYRIAFKKYIEYLNKKKITYAKTSDVINYREWRRAMGYSSQYLYIHICALKGLYRYLRINQKRLNLPEVYGHDVMAEIKNERINYHIKKPILTIQQAKHLILHTRHMRKYIWHYRNHAIIYLMITTGLKPVEVIHARRKDYLIKKGKSLLLVRKNGRGKASDFVKIPPGLKASIDEYLSKRRDDNPYLFISHRKISTHGHLSRTFFRRMFDEVLKACQMETLGITPHCLRHSAASLNLLRGGSIEQTKHLMRHAGISSTLVYAEHIKRMQDDSEDQIEAYILGEDEADGMDEDE
mgnify:CR=1 FL=1